MGAIYSYNLPTVVKMMGFTYANHSESLEHSRYLRNAQCSHEVGDTRRLHEGRRECELRVTELMNGNGDVPTANGRSRGNCPRLRSSGNFREDKIPPPAGRVTNAAGCV